MDNKDVTLYYWKIRGLGAPCATLLEYLNVPYNYHQYTDPESWKNDKKKLIEGGFLNPNLPYIKEKSSGLKLSETFAVLFHLAAKHKSDLAPKTTEEFRDVLVVKGIITDYNSGITGTTYRSNSTEELLKSLESTMRYHSSKTNYFKVTLEKNTWVLGEKLSFLDFYLAELLEKLVAMQDELKTEFVNAETLKVFRAYVKRFTALEAIKKFRESERFIKRPFNNVPKASWG